MSKFEFEWDEVKNRQNLEKHQISFTEALDAFADEKRLIVKDPDHSDQEARYFCIGKVDESVLTVRFTVRGKKIRIFGAGKWRKGKRLYEQKNK